MSPSQRSTSESHKAHDRKTLELRRARREISCAECRRLKLRCDKTFLCKKRVSDHLSERIAVYWSWNAALRRSVPTDTDRLHYKLDETSKRIRQLEDALQIAQAALSPIPHPLLSQELLGIKAGVVSRPDSPADTVEKNTGNDELDKDILSSFGTLTVSERGDESYIPSADALLLNHFGSFESQRSINTDVPSTLPKQATQLSRSFPFAPVNLPVDEIQALIEEKLPSYERASALVEAYLENLSWFMRPIDREQIMEELIPTIYKKRYTSYSINSNSCTVSNTNSPVSTASSSETPAESSAQAHLQRHTDPHALALLLVVFAAGAVADMTLPPCNDEAELYYHLSRAAMSLKPVFEGASLQSVQAIVLIGAYDIFSCRKFSLDGAWKMLSFGLALAASIGLHRDPARWNLQPKMIQRRRFVFWELFAVDQWKGLGSGKPTIFNPHVIDCEVPIDSDATLDEDGTETPSFWHLRQRFSREVVTEAVQKLGSARALKYSEILVLDRKVREFGPLQQFRRPGRTPDLNSDDGGVRGYLQRYMLNILKDSTLLLLHRNFFARAILENPVNPMRSAFAPSFLSAYRSATTLLRVVREHFEVVAHLLLRIWPIWAHALTASVILGSVAARGTTFTLAPQAFIEFDLAIGLFTKAQMHPVVKSGLPVLLRLRDKARHALNKHDNEIAVDSEYPQAETRPPKVENEKEFNVISGMGRMFRKGFEGGFAYKPKLPSEVLGVASDVDARATRLTAMSLSAPPTGVFSTFPDSRTDVSSLVSFTDVEAESPIHSSSSSGAALQQQGVRPISTIATTLQAEESIFTSSTRSAASNTDSSPPATCPTESSFAPQTPSAFLFDKAGLGQAPELSIQEPDYAALMDFTFDSAIDFSAGPSGPYDLGDSFPYSSFNPSPSLGGSAQAPSSALSSVDGSLSPQGPSAASNADFDVSFDMRAAAQESLLPLLPQDMEAWRTILQDSRFFIGAADEGSSV
ncbi:hypothetical protein DFH11DRAFT_1547404 [Phellopilus nigrolimitatus]|nr:hypothetical protein DFH11DRAFT_1547404 [Phellopilus nigrolimitatus]